MEGGFGPEPVKPEQRSGLTGSGGAEDARRFLSPAPL